MRFCRKGPTNLNFGEIGEIGEFSLAVKGGFSPRSVSVSASVSEK